jgi:hypothetical protein
MMEAKCSSEASVLARSTWHHIAKDGILQVENYLRDGNKDMEAKGKLQRIISIRGKAGH